MSYRARTLWAALLGWTFDGLEMGVFPLVARPALVELLGPSAPEELVRRWNGGLAIAFLIGAALGGWLFGWLGDRIGRVRAMIASVLTYSLLTAAGAFAATPGQLAACRFAAALGMGGEWALGVALVFDSWPERARPWLAGLIGAAVNVGYVVVAVLALVLPAGASWRTLLLFCAVPALMTYWLRRSVPEPDEWKRTVATGPPVSMVEIFTPELRGRTAIGAAAGAVVILATWGGIQLAQVWAAEMAGPRAAAWTQIASAGAGMLGAFTAPLLLADVSRKWAYVALCAFALAATQFLFWGHDSFGSSFLIASAWSGLATAAFFGWLPLFLPELFPARVRSLGPGFCYNVGRLLAAVGVAVTTFAVNLQGRYALAGAVVCLIYAIAILVVMAKSYMCQPM